MREDSLDALLQRSTPLINHVIGRHFTSNVKRQLEEMRADGLLGLWRAAQTHDPERASWTTWACLKVRRAIAGGIRERAQTRRRNRPVFVSLQSVAALQRTRDLPDPRQLPADDHAQRADLRAYVSRRAAKDAPIVLGLLDGLQDLEAAPLLGVSTSRVAQRKKDVLAYLSGMDDLREEFREH